MESTNSARFIVLDTKSGKRFDTICAYDIKQRRCLFIDILLETPQYTLLWLWDESDELGYFPVSTGELLSLPSLDIVDYIWCSFEQAREAVSLFDSHTMEILRGWKLGESHLIYVSEIAAALAADVAVAAYLDRIGVSITEPDEKLKSLPLSKWFNSAFNRIRLSNQDLFTNSPDLMSKLRDDYWRAVAATALFDLKSKGVSLSEIRQDELKQKLNHCIFEDEDSVYQHDATLLCGRALGITLIKLLDFANMSIKKLRRLLTVREAKNPPPKFLRFEVEPILPFGDVETAIKQYWESPGSSDMEIIRGGQSMPPLDLSEREVTELVTGAREWWEARYKELQGWDLNTATSCCTFVIHVFYWRRVQRRLMRSRYGIDMGRRRVLRKANLKLSPEEIGKRGFEYAYALALEVAAETAHFNRCFELPDGIDSTQGLSREIVEASWAKAAKAAMGVMEALPLFHMAIRDRAQSPVIHLIETCVLAGFAPKDINPHLFSRLRGFRDLPKYEQTTRLLGGVQQALAERRAGEPLISGRRAFKNRVAAYISDPIEDRKHTNQRQKLVFEDEFGFLKALELHQAKRAKLRAEFDILEIDDLLYDEAEKKAKLARREKEYCRRARQGLRIKEIASACGVKEGTVKTTMHRARKKLKPFLVP